MIHSETSVVYSLDDPRDRMPHYIGITDDVYARFLQHLRCDGSNFRKDAWIQELKAAQMMVIMTTREVVKTVEASVREAYWIHHYLHLGAPLLNNHIPTPLHLKSKEAQKQVMRQLHKAEYTAQSQRLTDSEREQMVLHLISQGKQQGEILTAVWGVASGGGAAYQKAAQQYRSMLSCFAQYAQHMNGDDVPPELESKYEQVIELMAQEKKQGEIISIVWDVLSGGGTAYQKAAEELRIIQRVIAQQALAQREA